eukprot:7790549-Pyramimonas_sp.AAC.1
MLPKALPVGRSRPRAAQLCAGGQVMANCSTIQLRRRPSLRTKGEARPQSTPAPVGRWGSGAPGRSWTD